jgi:hypothetical protein
MTAFNVVRMRVKPGREAEFLAHNRRPGHEVRAGLRRAWLVRTAPQCYAFIGEWESPEAIVAARPEMLADLDLLRPMLAELAPGSVTDAISGEAVATHVPGGETDA